MCLYFSTRGLCRSQVHLSCAACFTASYVPYSEVVCGHDETRPADMSPRSKSRAPVPAEFSHARVTGRRWSEVGGGSRRTGWTHGPGGRDVGQGGAGVSEGLGVGTPPRASRKKDPAAHRAPASQRASEGGRANELARRTGGEERRKSQAWSNAGPSARSGRMRGSARSKSPCNTWSLFCCCLLLWPFVFFVFMLSSSCLWHSFIASRYQTPSRSRVSRLNGVVVMTLMAKVGADWDDAITRAPLRVSAIAKRDSFCESLSPFDPAT